MSLLAMGKSVLCLGFYQHVIEWSVEIIKGPLPVADLIGAPSF